ncbi:MAG: hypothetical protein HQK89_05200 [Nitrospirae bacterium]|nr:hypothetical protein [Nitrospirota bacterium]
MKEAMIKLLLKEPIGMILACNILKSLDEGLIDKNRLKEFMQNVLVAFTEERAKVTEELIVQFEKVAIGVLPKEENRRKTFLFACDEPLDSMNDSDEFSTITKVDTLIKHLVKDTEVNEGHEANSINSDPSNVQPLKDFIDKLNKKLEEGTEDIYKPGARLGNNDHRPFFWIAPTKNIDEACRQKSFYKLGDEIRDLLGLIHYETLVPLVEIRIPGSKLPSCQHHRPTFADAGSHRRFKQHPEHASGNPGWGCTVHLRLFAAGDASIDGAPERVAERAFIKTLEVKLRFCGLTMIKRGDSENDDDMAFVKRIYNGENFSALKIKRRLKKRLLELF